MTAARRKTKIAPVLIEHNLDCIGVRGEATSNGSKKAWSFKKKKKICGIVEEHKAYRLIPLMTTFSCYFTVPISKSVIFDYDLGIPSELSRVLYIKTNDEWGTPLGPCLRVFRNPLYEKNCPLAKLGSSS